MARNNVVAPAAPVRPMDAERAGAGVTLTTRVSSADTGAAFVLLDVTVPPYWDGCAPHWHAHTTEVIYIVSGTLACTVGDTTTTASDGTAVLIPPGAVHTIWNPTAVPASYLAWFSPGGVTRHRHGPAARRLGVTLSATDDVLLAGAMAPSN